MDTSPPPLKPTPSAAPLAAPRRSKRWVLYMLLAALLLIGGCNMLLGLIMPAVVEKTIEMGSGVDMQRGDGTMTFTKDGESVTVSDVRAAGVNGEVALPDGFPEEFPMPDGMRIISATSFAAQGKEAFIIQAETELSVEDVVAFYERELAAKGWKQLMRTMDGGGAMLMMGTGEDADGQPTEGAMMQIGRTDNGMTAVSFTVGIPQ